MHVFARINHIGWVHLWPTREAYEAGEPSSVFFDPRTDPRWQDAPLSLMEKAALEARGLVEIEDPGYFSEDS